MSSHRPHEILSFLHLAASPPVRGIIEEALGWKTPFRHHKERDPHAVKSADFPDLPSIKNKYVVMNRRSHEGITTQKVKIKSPLDPNRTVFYLHRIIWPADHWKKEEKGWVVCRLPRSEELVRDYVHAPIVTETRFNFPNQFIIFQAWNMFYYHPGLYLQRRSGTSTEIIQFCPGIETTGHFREETDFGAQSESYYVTSTGPGGWETFKAKKPFYKL